MALKAKNIYCLSGPLKKKFYHSCARVYLVTQGPSPSSRKNPCFFVLGNHEMHSRALDGLWGQAAVC